MWKKGNPEWKPPPSRGVPSKECMWLPHKSGIFIKKKGGITGDILWTYKDIIDFIFPKIYQPKYYEVACSFLELFYEKRVIRSKDISEFLKRTGYSKATLENIVIPKLKRSGLLEGRRELSMQRGMKKGRPLVLQLSLTFSNYLEKISTDWKFFVNDARRRTKEEEINEAKEDNIGNDVDDKILDE